MVMCQITLISMMLYFLSSKFRFDIDFSTRSPPIETEEFRRRFLFHESPPIENDFDGGFQAHVSAKAI